MERNYQNILVAVDGSEQSEKAFTEATWLAMEHQSQLFIVYINNQMMPYREAVDEVTQLRKQIVEPVLNKKKLAHSLGIEKIRVIVESGNPKKYLAKILPKEHQIDLIVLGASSLGLFSTLLIGSTVNYVLNNAPCTVIVVR